MIVRLGTGKVLEDDRRKHLEGRKWRLRGAAAKDATLRAFWRAEVEEKARARSSA